MTERAILASGCFWGAQEFLGKLPGVISTRIGYCGDERTPHATFGSHGDHAESVEITFDSNVLTYRDLLEYFFQIHDPTTLNRQGDDIGRCYRSAIFTTTDEQTRVALDTITAVNESGIWPGPIVTEVGLESDFWEAEPEHQDFLQHYPDGYTNHFVRPSWKLSRQ
ncbi:peptide-methionine (S)-S-oxide reductase MsrA [Micromonospora chokoriensis]